MKHFKIAIKADHHEFEHACYTISEAFDAIVDAVSVFNIDADLEEVMHSLVDIDRGKIISHEDQRFTISLRGE